MSFRNTLSDIWTNIQYNLFPNLEERYGKLLEDHKNLAAVLELVRIEEFLPCTRFNNGRPPKDKACIARAFIAKIILKITNTNKLIQTLEKDKQLRIICGWESWSKIPSESKFSRVFREFAESSLPDKVHQALILGIYQDKPIGHLIKDSTPIIAREKAIRKEGSPKDRKNQMNKQYRKEKKEGLSRKQRQLKEKDLNKMIKELPSCCDIGAKKSAQGYKMIWKGYKLHAAVDDNCVPISVILTSASLNDSEVAIPLAEKSNIVAQNLYDLMDSAYDAAEIREHSLSLGHIPIIDKHSRSKAQKKEKKAEAARKKILNSYTAEDKRYKKRFSKERFNALFKDYYGGNNIFYKGHSKIFCHIMFGILSLTASTLLKLVQ